MGFLKQFLANSIKVLEPWKEPFKDTNIFFSFLQSQALSTIQNILQNSNIFNRSQKNSPFTPLGDRFQWCKINQLTVRTGKSEAMIITREDFIGSLRSVMIGSEIIRYVRKATSLGTKVQQISDCVSPK